MAREGENTENEAEKTHSSNHSLGVSLGPIQLWSNLIGDIVREHKAGKRKTYIEKDAVAIFSSFPLSTAKRLHK